MGCNKEAHYGIEKEITMLLFLRLAWRNIWQHNRRILSNEDRQTMIIFCKGAKI